MSKETAYSIEGLERWTSFAEEEATLLGAA